MIAVLFEGVHTNHYYDDYYEIFPLTSAVILIQRDGLNGLIDSGTPKYFPLLSEKLHERGLTPDDIHFICNTHFHLDHCGNDAFFPNAEVFVGRSKLNYKTGKATIYRDVQLMNYPCGIKMFLTPGHTLDHAVYLYEEDGKRYMCAGDAVREDIIRSQKVPPVHAPDQFISNMKMIFDISDIIVPGHGRVIRGSLKDELYKFVCGKWHMPT